MFFRKARIIHQFQMMIARLMGERDALQRAYDDMKRIADEALGIARQKEFVERYKQQSTDSEGINYSTIASGDTFSVLWAPDPDPYSEKFCPKCTVCVRSASWPVNCPACKTLFGDELDESVIDG